MKTQLIKLITIAGLILISQTGWTQTPYQLKANKIAVQGTSTLHEWESKVTKVEWKGQVELNENNTLVSVKEVEIKIPVTSIKSEHGKMMDNKTYEAFKSEKNPFIVYKLTNLKIKGTYPDQTLEATGALTMAGITKTIDLVVKSKVLTNDEIQFTLTEKLNMKDFSMEPPTAMMGTIKVGEEVTVKFEFTVGPNKIKL